MGPTGDADGSTDAGRSGRVVDAYTARARDYIDAVGSVEHIADDDRDFVLAWAGSVGGRILDVGSGPGQWTDLLRREGHDVEGVEPTGAFLDDARRRYPRTSYRSGYAEDLGVRDGSVGGILAWFSLIHTPPADLHAPLAEFGRCIVSGGTLAMGFFAGPAGTPFPHAITTAYYCSVDRLSEQLAEAGFSVTESRVRTVDGQRPQGRIIARR
ncbi:class I SAM-dependent methyltransferase [Gordonia shandongensis]|uniref:class I SAM-dependent methyltransferase n=1 Tax=Gordonia shandongensis TaxID=376351 RepID=UPI000685B83C|nr:class I SAM-dependent methyltransferase [Gordonia shandongensis]